MRQRFPKIDQIPLDNIRRGSAVFAGEIKCGKIDGFGALDHFLITAGHKDQHTGRSVVDGPLMFALGATPKDPIRSIPVWLPFETIDQLIPVREMRCYTGSWRVCMGNGTIDKETGEPVIGQAQRRKSKESPWEPVTCNVNTCEHRQPAAKGACKQHVDAIVAIRHNDAGMGLYRAHTAGEAISAPMLVESLYQLQHLTQAASFAGMPAVLCVTMERTSHGKNPVPALHFELGVELSRAVQSIAAHHGHRKALAEMSDDTAEALALLGPGEQGGESDEYHRGAQVIDATPAPLQEHQRTRPGAEPVAIDREPVLASVASLRSTLGEDDARKVAVECGVEWKGRHPEDLEDHELSIFEAALGVAVNTVTLRCSTD